MLEFVNFAYVCYLDSMASTVTIKNISISQLQNPLYVGEVTQTHDQDNPDSKLIQDLKNEIKELKRTVRELQKFRKL